MKKTDPTNLRRAAIRLLAGLIPSGSRAGIWNFAKKANMTVKVGSVNDNWRDLARNQSKKINSVGLYTNIENAIRKVSFDWKEPDPRYKRNIILLTDGHVDVSEDDKLDKASKKRIIKELLPKLEKAHVRVHTIALSDNVDESLLSTLSAYSDGLYKKVQSADELQKLFLQMLEQSVTLDTLPINNNSFKVDANVNDMTLLIFNKDKKSPINIVTPGKITWDKKMHLENVKWFSDEGFDLITIKKPQLGKWKIIAPTDKNNRVVVATNLKLKTNDLPSYIMFGDVIEVSAKLQEDGKDLTDSRLLSKFDFSIKRTLEGKSEWVYAMVRAEDGANIRYYRLPSILKEGMNEVVIKAKSPTAEREVRHQFKVYAAPAEIKISKKHDAFEIKVTPYANLMRPESVKIKIMLNDQSKHELKNNGDHWTLIVEKNYKQTIFNLNIKAIRADGKKIDISFNKILAVHDTVEKLTPHIDIHRAMPVHSEKTAKIHSEKPYEVKKEKLKKTNQSKDSNEVDADQKESDVNWTLIIISIVVGNTLIAGILGGGYIYMQRRKEKMINNVKKK